MRLIQLEEAQSFDKGHGRVEIRRLQASDRLQEHVDWPGFAQAIRLERTRIIRGQRTTEISYAVTSIGSGHANAAKLLAISRGHWGIENRLHWIRDVVFGEDRCRVRTGEAPQNLAALRNAAINLIRTAGIKGIQSAIRRFATKPWENLAILKH